LTKPLEQPETARVTAERLAQNFNYAFRGSYVPTAYREATDAIEAALNAEREQCAKIAETAFTEFQTGYNAGKWIAARIRGNNHAD